MRLIGLDTIRSLVRPGHVVEGLTAMAMALALGMLALGGVLLLESRAEAWHRAGEESDRTILAYARDIERTIALDDQTLQSLANALARPDIDRLSRETRQFVLFERTADSEFRRSLIVANPRGEVIAASLTPSQPGLNVAAQPYFKTHLQAPDAGLFIGRPFADPARNNEAAIAISRRLSRPDGTFAGVVAGTIPLAYFSGLFAAFDLGSGGPVTLLQSDGRVVMRLPYQEADIGRDIADTPVFRGFAAAEAGRLAGSDPIDGVNRLHTFRHLPNRALILTAGVAVADIEGAWWPNALSIAAVLAVLCGATMVLCRLFRREIMRRMLAEATLRGAAVQLAMTPATDGLTGLANRRAFDERLTREWGRAIRAGTPIALLLLDADLFKGFNDRYGHGEGDQVLRSIAKCIARNVLRPSDTNARYSGEEFAVLLPETDLTGAAVVAERIRAGVAAQGIPYEGHPAGHVTVSIGVSIARPSPGDAHASLVARTNAALIAAKDAGRNVVSRAAADGTASVGEPALFRQSARVG